MIYGGPPTIRPLFRVLWALLALTGLALLSWYAIQFFHGDTFNPGIPALCFLVAYMRGCIAILGGAEGSTDIAASFERVRGNA